MFAYLFYVVSGLAAKHPFLVGPAACKAWSSTRRGEWRCQSRRKNTGTKSGYGICFFVFCVALLSCVSLDSRVPYSRRTRSSNHHHTQTNEKRPSPTANAVLTLRERTDGTGGSHATTTIRLTEEECLELRDSMDEAAKRVTEVMEKYGGNG